MAITELKAPVYLYALLDPRTKEPRYVGKSVRHPSLRIPEHFAKARTHTGPAHKGAWLRLLDRLSMKPELFILGRCPAESWRECERFWIAHLRSKGYDLLNVSLGGDGGGMQGRRCSLEHRRKISESNKGRVVTPETRQRISEAIRTLNGSHITENTRAIWQRQRKGQQNARGHMLSQEAKERIRQALIGRHPTEEARQKMRSAHRRNPQRCSESLKLRFSQERQRLAEEDTNNLRCLVDGGEPRRVIAWLYGIGSSTATRIINRQRYCDGI